MTLRSYDVHAVTLKSLPLGENDRIITLYTRERGIVRAVAKGVKKARSRLGGRLDLMHCNQLTLHKGRNLDVITEASTIQSFPRLRDDLPRLGHSLYMVELILALTTEEDPHSDEVFDLLVTTLHTLEHFEPIGLLVHWFELQLLTLLGYRPQLGGCLYCDQPALPEQGTIRFDVIGGGVVCRRCPEKARKIARVPADVFELWRSLKDAPLAEIFTVAFHDHTLGVAARNLRQYIAHTAETEFKTLRTLDALTEPMVIAAAG